MTKEELLRELTAGGYLKTPALIDAFRRVDRKDFVPPGLVEEAYGNYPLPIGQEQTISQPLTVAFMLELLSPQSGEKILEIGAGSGWQTALLADLAGAQGKVFAIERIPELKEMAERNVSKYDFTKKGIVKIMLGDGSKGYAEGAPYNKIIAAASLSAGRQAAVPEVWKKQLKVGGRIVAPVGDSILAIDKLSEKDYKIREYPGFAFVPLIKD